MDMKHDVARRISIYSIAKKWKMETLLLQNKNFVFGRII